MHNTGLGLWQAWYVAMRESPCVNLLLPVFIYFLKIYMYRV